MAGDDRHAAGLRGDHDPDTYAITIVPRDIPAGYTGVLAASQAASGRVELVNVDPAHPPATKAAMARARTALARAARKP